MQQQVLTADDIMREGLLYMNFSVAKQASRSYDKNWVEFKKHYGVSPTVVAEIWHDLCTTDIEKSKLSDKEKGQKGLKYLFMVIYFMYSYPRNRHNLASTFGICDKLASGNSFWTWASRLAGLKEKVIFFPEEFSDPNGRPFIMTLDCRDHKCTEKKHPTFNLDRAYSSKKHGFHASLKYELGVAIFYDQIVWIKGPYKASMHDMTVFRLGGLKEIMLQSFPDKYIIVDRGYQTSDADEYMMAYPSSSDPLPLKKFKSLARCREEDVNGRMANFKVLNHEYTHSVQSHEISFTCVAVLIQYQLNCGDAYLPKL